MYSLQPEHLSSYERDTLHAYCVAAIVKNCLNQEALRTRCHRFFSVTLHETVSFSTRFLEATTLPNRAITVAN